MFWESFGKVPGKYQESARKVPIKCRVRYRESTVKMLGIWGELLEDTH